MATDNRKFVVTVIVIFLVLLIFSCVYMSWKAPKVDCDCNCKVKELYSDVGQKMLMDEAEFDPTNKIQNNFQRIDLNSPEDESGLQKNLLFGKANKIRNEGTTTLDVEANLYVLGGDTYDSGIMPALGVNSDDGKYTKFVATEEKEKYKLYLTNKNGEKYIGELKKDGDGIYKLKTDLSEELTKLKTVNIYFENDDAKVLVLTGSFQ